MKQHPDTEILRAIADGEPLENFEIRYKDWANDRWNPFGEDYWIDWFYMPENWQFRRKQKTIMVNGFEVPEPVQAGTKLYTHPQQASEPMTDEQIDAIGNSVCIAMPTPLDPVPDDVAIAMRQFARAIESAATAPLLKRIAELEELYLRS